MDDPQIFADFLSDALNIQPARARLNLIDNLASTFSDLLMIGEKDAYYFTKSEHSMNSGRPAAQRVTYSAKVIKSLNSVRFELKDRALCNATPGAGMLAAIDAAQVRDLTHYCSLAKEDATNRDTVTASLMDLTIPVLTSKNYDDWETQFSQLVSRKNSTAGPGISLDYLLRLQEVGTYIAVYEGRAERLKNCMVFTGSIFKTDREALFSLLVQYVGTTGIGSSTVNSHKNTKNGRKCFLDLRSHFKNDSYLDRLATEANKTLSNLVWNGTRQNFTIVMLSSQKRSINLSKLVQLTH
jgi:hypothetical protein